MTPGHIFANEAYIYGLNADGDHWGSATTFTISSRACVRPVISLIHQIYIASGSGTATDPWIVEAP